MTLPIVVMLTVCLGVALHYWTPSKIPRAVYYVVHIMNSNDEDIENTIPQKESTHNNENIGNEMTMSSQEIIAAEENAESTIPKEETTLMHDEMDGTEEILTQPDHTAPEALETNGEETQNENEIPFHESEDFTNDNHYSYQLLESSMSSFHRFYFMCEEVFFRYFPAPAQPNAC